MKCSAREFQAWYAQNHIQCHMIGLPWYEEVLRPNCEEEQVSSARAQAVMLHAAMKF
jgi:hypothetical protein